MLPFSRFARYFQEVARQGNLRKAAEKLHVSASAIDRQILAAETELETPLFERCPGGLKLTAGGELLFAELRRWDKDYRRLKEQLDDLRGLKRGYVSISMIDALSDGFLPRIIASLRQAYPQLGFQLNVQKNTQVVEAVTRLESDLGLLLEPEENASLEVLMECPIPIGVVVPPDHPLTRYPTVALSQTLSYQHIVPAAPLIIHQYAQSIYSRVPLEDSQVVTCNDIRTMCALIRAGVGIGILSRLDVAEAVESGQVTFIPLKGKNIRPLTLALCIAPRRQLSKAAQMVIDSIRSHLQTLALPPSTD